MPTSQEMIDALEAEYAHEREFTDGLPADSRNAHGTEQAWSARDLQAHISAWKHQAVLRLRNDPSAVVEQEEQDTDRANADIFEAYAGRSWESVLEESDGTHHDLVEELGKLSGEELAAEDRYPWQQGQPVWRRLAGTLLSHPWMHMAEHAIEREDPAGAIAEAAAMIETLSPLSPEGSWIGTLTYNAACIVARAGQVDRAFTWLEQGLAARPDLVAWSKQDSDLDSLRGDDRLARLYEDVAG